MKKQYKSWIIKIPKIANKKSFDGVPVTHSHTMTPFDAPGKQYF